MLATGELLHRRYRLGPLVGQGGMADVRRAEDLVTGDDVAVKLLRRLPDGAPWSAREIHALERLNHASLVRLRDCGVDHDVPFLVLDLVEGASLADELARGPLGTRRTIEVIAAVADGLAHAHARGVTHRDVKPGNILLDKAGRARLADFGIARLADGTPTTGAGFVIGTAAYLAPEQVRSSPVGPAADVYALGLVLLECLTGRRAYPGTFAEAAIAHVITPPEIPSTVPAWLAAIVASMTAHDPALRPSAASVAGALRRPPAEEGPPTALVTDASPRTEVLAIVPRPRRRRWPAAVAAAVVATLGLAGALFAVDRSDSTPQTPPVVPAASTTAAPTTAATVPPTTVAPAPPTTSPPATAAATTASPGNGKGKDKRKGHG
jgi:eukaryotic-like serine/threonine-protein kinase